MSVTAQQRLTPIPQDNPQVVSRVGEEAIRVNEDVTRLGSRARCQYPKGVGRMRIAMDHHASIGASGQRAAMGEFNCPVEDSI